LYVVSADGNAHSALTSDVLLALGVVVTATYDGDGVYTIDILSIPVTLDEEEYEGDVDAYTVD